MYVCKNRVCSRRNSFRLARACPHVLFCFCKKRICKHPRSVSSGSFHIITFMLTVSATTSAVRLCCNTETGWNTFVMKETGSHCWPVRSSEIINDVFTSSFEFLETYWRGERCEISSVLDVQTRSNRFEVVVSCSLSVLICSSSHRPPVESNLPLRNGGPYSSSSDKLSSAGRPRRRNDYDDYNSSGDELDDDDFDR